MHEFYNLGSKYKWHNFDIRRKVAVLVRQFLEVFYGLPFGTVCLPCRLPWYIADNVT